ncbi:MAG: manganese efflux pump MntP family protein [Promethearchaeia archaeon]
MQALKAILFGLALSIDSFTISTTFGLIGEKKSLLRSMNIIGITCGVGQCIFLILGWTAGSLISALVLGFSKWIGFFLLCALSVYMVLDCFRKNKNQLNFKSGLSFNFKIILVLMVSTSFDVLSVGITFGIIQQKIILLVVFTFIFTYFSAHVGGQLGFKIGEKAGNSYGQIIGAFLIFCLACFLLL